MKNSRLEYIILYVLIACVALVLATLARAVAVGMGFDEFTAFMVFVVVLGIASIVYLSIHVVLQDFMLPLIGKGLSKIPFFRDKIESIQPVEIIAETGTEAPSLEDIRNKQLQNRIKEQEEKLNIALDYTRNTFAPYVSDKDVEIETIKSHLKDDELKGNIKIRENLSEQ